MSGAARAASGSSSAGASRRTTSVADNPAKWMTAVTLSAEGFPRRALGQGFAPGSTSSTVLACSKMLLGSSWTTCAGPFEAGLPERFKAP